MALLTSKEIKAALVDEPMRPNRRVRRAHKTRHRKGLKAWRKQTKRATKKARATAVRAALTEASDAGHTERHDGGGAFEDCRINRARPCLRGRRCTAARPVHREALRSRATLRAKAPEGAPRFSSVRMEAPWLQLKLRAWQSLICTTC
jgi:hypothetical protein